MNATGGMSPALRALDRVTAITYPDATENVSFTYDTCPFGVGRLCGRSDESGVVAFAYDAFGNLVTETRTELGVTYTTGYTYDAGDRITAITYPSGRVVSVARDGIGRIESIGSSLNGASTPVLSGVAYRADDALTARVWGNGLAEARSYDLQGRLRSQSLGAVDTRSYAYDANGNVVARPATPQNKAYGYDALDRLVSDGTDGAVLTLGYDPNGNQLSRSAADASRSEAYAYASDTNRLMTVDAVAASLPPSPSPAVRTLDYNDAGRLSEVFDDGVLTATYVYNADGLRTRKVTAEGTIVYHYDPAGHLIAETREDGTPVRDYLWQGAEPVAQIDNLAGSERIVFLHTDHLGTPRFATDPTGTIVWRWEGEAFGRTPANEDPDGDGIGVTVNLRFPGQYFDAETGRHYNRFRTYDQDIGRYVTPDPIGLVGGDNLYAYASGNSLRFADASGLVVPAIAGCAANPACVAAAVKAGEIAAGVSLGILTGLALNEAFNNEDDKRVSNDADDEQICPIPDVSPGRETKGRTKQFEKSGDFGTAVDDFNSQGPTSVQGLPGGGLAGDLPNGDKIIVRPTSTDGRPTLEIQSGKNRVKVRYGR